MNLTLLQGAYIIAGLFFILALAGLSKHETAKAGNLNGIVGMTIALVVTILAAVLGVKASGGIRSADDALAMLEAGATRLGLSGTRGVLDDVNAAEAQ